MPACSEFLVQVRYNITLYSIIRSFAMSLQDIQLANNQRKRLRKAITDKELLQEDEGTLVLNVASYLNYKALSGETPVETIIGDVELNYSVEYIVFN